MTEIIFVIEEDAVDGGFVARALEYGITTQADTIPELKQMLLDAVRCHFDKPDNRPKLIRLHFVRDEVLAVSGTEFPS